MSLFMNSRLYACQVMHARFRPRPHRFAYRIFMFALDLDELDDLDRRLHLFSLHRPNLYRLRDQDFLPLAEPRHNTRPPAPMDDARRYQSARLKARVLGYLAEHGIEAGPDARVELISLPRILGYLFNPVSFYFVRNAAGKALAAIPEVTNTFREMKPYLLGPNDRQAGGDEASPVFRRRVTKEFYVSPFSDVDVAFDFRLRFPDDSLQVQIDDYDGEGRTLTSTLTGQARPLTDANLAWFLVQYPLLTLRVIALIHWHALRLWLKKVPWFPKAARADQQRDLYRPHASLGPHPPQSPNPRGSRGPT